MKLLPDDPRLTAYALGEMDNLDPAEREEIQNAVAASAELQRVVADIRATAAALQSAFSAEQPAAPDREDTAGIYAAVERAGRSRKPQSVLTLIFWPAFGAVAALLLLALILVPGMLSVHEVRQEATGDDDVQIDSPPAPPAADGLRAENGKPLDEQAVRQVVEKIQLAEQTERLRRMEQLQQGSLGVVRVAEPRPVVSPAPNGSEPVLRQQDPLPERTHFALESSRGVSSGLSDGRIERKQLSVSFFGMRGTAGPPPPLSSAAIPAAGPVEIPGPRPVESFRYRTQPWNTDAFDPIDENIFRSPLVAPLSTFAIDVDTASYAVVRSRLEQGVLPPASAVRIEELVNSFPYADAPPEVAVADGGNPFAVHTDLAPAPWAPDYQLLRVNLKGYEVPWEDRPPSNLVFLIDVSGSMRPANRLPLVKDALGLLVERLDERDRVAIVVYAGQSKLTLPSTTANNRETIQHAINELVASGSTHASDGIQQAYRIARQHFIKGGNNRVILCSDGDFNVGITDRGELGEFVKKQADEGVSLTILGFGMGNYKDNMLETLSAKGSGTYAFIDTLAEARKFFLGQIASNLFTIASDVRIQIEFNPAAVKAYRLIGYENRLMKAEDFNDDSKRAGQIGPGHTVTAFYEIVPAGVEFESPGVDPLRYQTQSQVDTLQDETTANELATIKVRFKRPGQDTSELIEQPIFTTTAATFADASSDFRFGAAVAAFGMRLRDSENLANFSWQAIRTVAREARGPDTQGYRTDFLKLVDQAEKLKTLQMERASDGHGER